MSELVVDLFGYPIPVWDYVTLEEASLIEELLVQNYPSKVREDLELVAIFARTRLGIKNFSTEKALKERMDGDNLRIGIEMLIAPFVEARKERTERLLSSVLESMDPDELAAEIVKRERQLEEMKEILEDRLADSND